MKCCKRNLKWPLYTLVETDFAVPGMECDPGAD